MFFLTFVHEYIHTYCALHSIHNFFSSLHIHLWMSAFEGFLSRVLPTYKCVSILMLVYCFYMCQLLSRFFFCSAFTVVSFTLIQFYGDIPWKQQLKLSSIKQNDENKTSTTFIPWLTAHIQTYTLAHKPHPPQLKWLTHSHALKQFVRVIHVNWIYLRYIYTHSLVTIYSAAEFLEFGLWRKQIRCIFSLFQQYNTLFKIH